MFNLDISPRQLLQGMDRVQIQLSGGHKVCLARIKDQDGVWLGMREVFNKLAPLYKWQHFHSTSQKGESIAKASDTLLFSSECMSDSSCVAFRGNGIKSSNP